MNSGKTSNKSIALIGNQSISKFLIDYLRKKKINIKYLLTLKKKKKYKVTDSYNFRENIKTIYLNSYNLKDEKDIKIIKKIKIDFLLVFGWSRLIPTWLIQHVKESVIGVHAGMFSPPRSRGRAVFNWSLIGNFKKMIFYSMELKPGVDDGDIFIKERASISSNDDIESLYMKNAIISSDMFYRILKNWKYYKKNKIPQKNTRSTYLPKRNPDDGFVNWKFSSYEIYNFIRALKKPYPGAFSLLKNKKIIFNDAIPFELKIKGKFVPGEIVYIFPNNKFVIKCGKGFLLIKKFSSPHKIYLKANFKFTSSKIKKFNFNNI
jgi:methionyl-tRNA formyltransferase